MYCSRCGHRNDDDANFCSMCGAPLVEGEEGSDTHAIPLQPEPQAEAEGSADTGDLTLDPLTLDDVGPGNAVLVVKHGPNAGTKYVLAGDVARIGRHPESDLFLDDVTVSRRHAEIRHNPDASGEGSAYRLRDVGSLNGTYCNGVLIDETDLDNGDEVRIGKFVIIFLEGE